MSLYQLVVTNQWFYFLENSPDIPLNVLETSMNENEENKRSSEKVHFLRFIDLVLFFNIGLPKGKWFNVSRILIFKYFLIWEMRVGLYCRK